MNANWLATLSILSAPPQAQDKAFVIYLAGPCPMGKFYIGQTSDFKARIAQHRPADGSCPAFHEAIKQFGFVLLTPRIIAQTDSIDEVDRLEGHFIQLFNSRIPHGYNMTLGGAGGRFDPASRVTDFSEMPVSDEEIREMAQHRVHSTILKAGARGCRPNMCDDRATNCLTQYLYQIIADGKTHADADPIEQPQAAKYYSELPEFGHFEYTAMSMLGLGEKERLKSHHLALKLYAENLFTYVTENLRADVLYSRGVPFRHPKPFLPVPKSTKSKSKQIGHDKYMRKLFERRFKGQGIAEGNVALVDAFLLEKKKGFEFSPSIAIGVGFSQEMVSMAAQEALERVQRGETLEDYQRDVVFARY